MARKQPSQLLESIPIDPSICSHPGCGQKWVINGKCRAHANLDRPTSGEPLSRAQAASVLAELKRRFPHLKRGAV